MHIEQWLKQLQEVNDKPASAGSRDWLLEVSPSLNSFEGHFPDFPVLPAASILDASLLLLGVALGSSNPPVNFIRSAKFIGIIHPGATLRLQLQQSQANLARISWLSADCSTKYADIDIELNSNAKFANL